MKNCRQFFLLLIFLIPLITSSQNNYFVSDTATNVGVVLVDGDVLTNQMVCKVKKGKTIVEYTPWQVREYGFEDGTTYLAKNIPVPDSTRRVFLERLVKGKYSLYYYEGEAGTTFFLEQDSTLFVELTKHGEDYGHRNFRDDLRHYTADCPQMADAIKLVRYNRAGYKKLMKQYEKCKKRPFPFLKFGISAGYSACKLVPKSTIPIPELSQMEYRYEGGFVAGIFMECPVLLSDISVVAELLYTHHDFAASTSVRSQEFDYFGKMSSLQLPVLVRYAFPSNRIRPFLNVGAVFLFNFNNEEMLYSATIGQNVIEINDMPEITLIPNSMIGYSIGGGFAVQILPRNWFSVDIRYNSYYALTSSRAMDISEFQIKSGISF